VIKGLIWFNNIDLYNRCETEARKLDLPTAPDFVTHCCEQEILKKFSKKGIEKKLKKAVDIWIEMKDMADELRMTVPELIELLCYRECYPDGPTLVAAPAKVEPPPVAQATEHREKSIIEKIGDAVSLPRG
jgi:hypothetical protein